MLPMSVSDVQWQDSSICRQIGRTDPCKVNSKLEKRTVAPVVPFANSIWLVLFTPLLLADFSAVRASLRSWSYDELDDGVARI
jgi:hypothetical protein